MSYKDKNQERAQRKVYYRKNRKVILERAKAWNLKHPDRIAENKKKFFEKHKDYWKQK